MKPIPIPLLFLLAGLALPAFGAELACPDLARAVQVASCPSDEELRYTFTGYCSDDKLRYKGDTDVCTTFEGRINLVVCDYGDGLNFTHRTRAECRVSTAACVGDASACKAICD